MRRTPLLLARLRVCAPSDQALHEEVLIKLASASSLHQAARGDEAEYDANMAARMRTFRFVFVTLFTLFFAGLLMFGLAAFYNGNHYETKAANKHSRDGLLVFWGSQVGVVQPRGLGHGSALPRANGQPLSACPL